MPEIREPYPFTQDKHGCEVAVCQQTVYLLEGETLDYGDVSWQLNRQPGEYVDPTEKVLWMLRRGYQVTCKGSFDEARLRQEGPVYIREFYDNDPTLEEYLQDTETAIATFTRSEAKMAQLKPYMDSGQYVEKVGTNTVSDITHTLALGGLAHATLGKGYHSVVIYDTTPHSAEAPIYCLFNPREPGESEGLAILTRLPHEYMAAQKAFDCEVFHVTATEPSTSGW